MLIASFAAGPLAANCYVVAPHPGGECVVIDPGMDAVDTLAEVLAEHRLTPAAVLLSHGHLDHVADAATVAARWTSPTGAPMPCWVHPADRSMLTDPRSALPEAMQPLIDALVADGASFEEPADLRSYVNGERLLLADLQITVITAPGHTGGSVLLRTGYPDDESVDSLLFTGDVLFAGTIGRTDLPGGDHATMLDTLRRHLLTLPDTVVVLPGHGAQTTIARERAINPYLSAAHLT